MTESSKIVLFKMMNQYANFFEYYFNVALRERLMDEQEIINIQDRLNKLSTLYYAKDESTRD